MEGDGMVAVVRGLREAGLAVTLLDGNRQYTLLPNTTTQPASTQNAVGPKVTIMHASTQQCPSKFTADTSTEPAKVQCDRNAQAVDGRYASMYKTMHCNMRPTSPPVQLSEFPPQRPELYPGHGNFIVGGSGSGANDCPMRPTSPINSFRGGMSWPDRGSVCSPRPSRMEDAFVKSLYFSGSVCSPRPSRMEDAFVRSLRKYPNCLSPDRSSEVMERLVNYSQAKGLSRNYRNSSSPNRSTEPSSQNVLDSKALTVAARSRSYEPDVSIRPRKNEDSPTRDRRNDDHYDKPIRGSYDVRYLRDMTKRMRDSGGRPYTSYSSNSVNMEIQAAVKMLSKEVATLPRVDETRKTVAVPESPNSSAGEDYEEGEFYYVENMDIRTSIKSIQTNFYPSDTTLKPKKSAQTVFSTIDFHSSRNRTIVSRKSKSQEAIKLTKDELKISLLELINEISDTVSKNTIRDELIKKLFDTSERTDHICDAKIKHGKCHKYVADCCPTVCDYVGDYEELVGKLKHCYGDAKNVLRSEIKPFRLSEYRQLDFVLKDWVNHLNLTTDDIGRSIERRDLLSSVEERIKELLKNWTKEDFDLKSEIVDILQEIPIEVNKSYGMKSYLRKLVDVLLKRMRNVIVTEQTGRVKRRPFASRSKKILTEEDMRDFVREHLLNYANESNSRISNKTLYDLENELVDLIMDSVESIWCGHDDEIIDEMEIILQDLGKISNKHANYISNLMLQDLQDMLNNCVFNQTYTILNVSNNSGQYMNSNNNTDFSIGSITEEDLQANLDRYTNQLCLQINQWLDALNILQNQDSGFREVVVNDLAGDIVDRHKYIELNHTSRDSDQDQLEALKYQIFKWINKLVGDDNQETINHAENLLQRINSVPVPMLVNPKHRSTGGAEVENTCPNAGRSSPKPYSQPVQSKPCCGKETCSNTPKDGKGINKIGPFSEVNSFPNAGTFRPQGIQGQTGRGSCGLGAQTRNAPQVESSLTNGGPSFGPASPNNTWGSNSFSSGFTGNLTQPRQGIPSGSGIGTCGPSGTNQPTMHDPNQYQASSSNRPGGSVPVKKLNEDYDEYLKQWVKKIPIADKTAEESARLNVYNGTWKAVTKMKLDPNIFGNQYYCQDVLEEEMERLLQGVPQSQELEAAKPALKAQLLQKTLAMNDLIKSTNAPASFKQQLMDNIENNLPERTPTENEEDKANDELEKQNIADYYILFTRFKNEDNVKATVHRNNFLKKLDEYLNKIKNRHNLADMETTAYANEIINSLEKIPTPNLSAIKDEADEILLAMEVENWISDIPKNTSVGRLEQRRMRDAIVKKIQEIGLGGVSCCDNAFRAALKTELPKNLEKISIQEGTDKDYLIDELANRIKNLSTSIRRVSFQEPEDYEAFSSNMPFSSSMHEMTGDRSSYLIAGQNIVKCSRQVGMRLGGGRQGAEVPEEDIQWLSMDRTEIPSQMRSGYVAPQGRQSPQLCNPIESGHMPQRPQSSQVNASNAPDCCAPLGRCNVSGGNISRDAGPNRTWGSERAPVPQKRQKMSIQDSRASPSARNRCRRPESARSQLNNPNDSLAGRSFPGQGNFGTDTGPRLNWVGGQTPVPEEDMQWYSMEMTELPSQMRSMSSPRSPPVCGLNSADQAATQSYPGTCQMPSIFTPNTQAPFVPARDIPIPNAADQPTIQRNYLSNRLIWAGGQTPVPEEDIQWFSMERTELPSQMRSMPSPSTRSSPVPGLTSVDQAEIQTTPNKLGTVHDKKSRKEPKNKNVKAVDVQEKEVFNFKSVQTALSTIDITTTKCKYYEIRSKSQVELTKTTNKQEVIKRTSNSHEDLHQEVTEWFEIHSDKVRVKLWGEKMKKLVEKLKKPGGEEKLRSKIEKFMKQTPDINTGADNDIVEFRKQLPDNIVRKLKKMYSTQRNVNIYRIEIPKYCSRFKIDNFRRTVLNWTKTLNIKKKDFLGRNVNKEDVFKFVVEKLEPVVLDRPQSDSEYKEALKSSITEIVYDLPIAISTHNKDLYLNKAIKDLVENIFTIDNKFTSTYIQPTTKEIKEFVKDEITYFLEKCRVAISTKRMEYLEIELVHRLLNLTVITDFHSNVADDVTKLLKEVSKLPQYKAKYFTNLILKDYKEFFFRENFFHQKGNSERGRPEVYTAFQNASDLVDFNEISFDTYKQKLEEEINKWLTKLNIPINDKTVLKVAVKDLAGDIVDRYKYLLLNPSLSGKDAEELEQLKFQIFKWTNKLVGEENTTVLERAHELMNVINNIPKPSLQDTSVVSALSPLNSDEINNTSKAYIDKLTDEIYDWYSELPVNFYLPEDARHNKMLIKELAQEIKKRLENNEDGVTDKAVRKWTEKVFNNKLGYYDSQQLKNRINNVPYTKDSRKNDLRHEKNLIRSYEDIVDEWIDTIPIAPIKLQLFISYKNEIVHSLAVKIFKLKSKLKQLPAEVVENKLQEELSHWLKKLPLHVKVDNQNDRDKYAAKLAKSIQRINDFSEKHPKLSDESVIIQLETVMLHWLKNMPLYREKSLKERQQQETAIKGLAFKLSQTIGNDDADLDEEIFKQIRMLDPKQNNDNVHNAAFRLKLYLQKLDLYKELCKQREKENKLLVDTIEVWLKNLSFQITDVEGFQKQKADFIKSVKKLISSGSDNAVMKKEILVFTKTLPLSHSKKHDSKYLNAEVLKLVKSLNREPIGDVCSLSSGKSNEMISDAIKVWTSTLPLKPVYCPRELHCFTDDILCSIITSIVRNPDQNSTREQNYARLYEEITKFLRRLPLIYELSTESHIRGMAAELSKSLKNISLFRNNKYIVNNMTVYDVSVKNNTHDHSIQESVIYENLDTFSKQLVQQITEWFDRLNLPEGNQGFKEVVISDLAADIVDRHKYLELNPYNKRSEQDEVEHLKYQIFKWINKLVGEENNETIAHAEELMQRVKSIPVPMLVRPQYEGQAELPKQYQCCEQKQAPQQSRNAPPAQPGPSNRMDPINRTSKPCCSQEPPTPPPPPDEGSIDAMCQKFITVFTDHCNALPLDDSTPYAQIARQTIVNGILLTFFKLKGDPVIENDYEYFEFLLEGKIDKLLDELPQTEELKKMRQLWITRVLGSALRLLNEMQVASDRTSFRQNVKDNFNRQLAIDTEIQNCCVLQLNFLNSVADAYILQVNYKEKDPVKANIYKNRLMGEVDKLVNHMIKEHNVGFRVFNQSKLRRIAMKALEQVPVPADDILQDEVEEIHLADEIEKWYKKLPTKPPRSDEETVAIKRMIDLLAKKLNDMHKHLNDDNLSMEDKMKHEVSHFLERRKVIQDDYDHKITDMVDVLFSRLNDRWSPVQDPEGFDEFAHAKPLSSTLAHVDNAEFLAPLMNAGTSTNPQTAGQETCGNSGYFIQPGLTMQDRERVPFCSLISPVLGPNMSRQVRSPRVNLEDSQFGPRQGITQQSLQAAVQETSGALEYYIPPGQNLDPNVSRQVPCNTSQGRPSEDYTSQPGAPCRRVQATPPRSNLEGSQFGPRQIIQQSPQRPNLSQQVKSPRQPRQSPQSVQNTSQRRGQSINQSIRQVAFGGQMGPQDQRDQTLAGQVRRSCGTNQLLGNLSIRGPTPSQGIGTTADAAIGGTAATSQTRETRATGAPVSSDEDVLDGEFRVKCRCLDAYRRMQSMDYDEQCEMFRSYRFTY